MKKQDRYDSLIQFYAEEYSLDWKRVKAQIRAESNYDPDAKSIVGALGLAQFMRATWLEWKDGKVGFSDVIADDYSRNNPEHSIKAMCAYIKWLYSYIEKKIYANGTFQEDRNDVMFACYNWGIGNVKKHIWTYGHLNALKIPVETLSYIKRINQYYKELL